MPIATTTMILLSAGLQIYNSWCGNKQNSKLQAKREEFEKAAMMRKYERMWQIQREAQELMRQQEEDRHQQSLSDLRKEVDNLVKLLAKQGTIDNWPLNVLPLVMKNQALGNLLSHQEERIALHCIMTRSNCSAFNKYVYPKVEMELEDYCNKYWRLNGNHPILYYSGAWKSLSSPKGTEIDSMRLELSNLPTLVISPLFHPNDGHLFFQVSMWGFCASSSDESGTMLIEPTELKHEYKIGMDYSSDPTLTVQFVSELVPYLKCVIGFMADTYFWSALSQAPQLPSLLKNGAIETGEASYLLEISRQYYSGLLVSCEESTAIVPFSQNEPIKLFKECLSILKGYDVEDLFVKSFLSYCEKRNGKKYENIEDALMNGMWNKKHLAEISEFAKIAPPKYASVINQYLSDSEEYHKRNIYISDFDWQLYKKEFSEEFDLMDVIERFEEYLERNKGDIDFKDIALAIENVQYKEFHTHLYNAATQMIVRCDEPFDFSFSLNRLKRIKNVRSIFKNQNYGFIYCKLEKLDSLKHRLTKLIY